MSAVVKLLPEPWPEGAAGHHAELLTRLYGLHSALASAKVWGRRADSPVEMHLDDGTVIRFDRASELRKLETLDLAIGLHTDGRSRPEPLKIEELRDAWFALLAFAQVQEADDHTSEVEEWVQRFLRSAGGSFAEWDLSDGAQRYEALGHVQTGRYDPQAGTVPTLVRDTATGEVLLRSTDLFLFVQRTLGEH